MTSRFDWIYNIKRYNIKNREGAKLTRPANQQVNWPHGYWQKTQEPRVRDRKAQHVQVYDSNNSRGSITIFVPRGQSLPPTECHEEVQIMPQSQWVAQEGAEFREPDSFIIGSKHSKHALPLLWGAVPLSSRAAFYADVF